MDFIGNIQTSGRLALDLVLYLMLPITVVMGGFMKVLENKGVLAWCSEKLSHVTHVFGASGLSVIATAKMLFVSSVAPLPTLHKLEQMEQDQRKLAASLALVLTLTQGNVSFPMIAYGVDIWALLASSLIGGLLASVFTYYFLAKNLSASDNGIPPQEKEVKVNRSVVQSLSEGGMEGMRIAINMIPLLVITIFIMSVLKDLNVIGTLTQWLEPVFALLGLPGAAVLPIITKYVAGGTAYMGVMIDQIEQGALSARDLNIIVGLASNPVDLVGIAIFSVIGPRINKIFRLALLGAFFGLFTRAVMHIVWFM
ncbi:nucleoside recognition family protein [Maribrevibacterium harenarium]|uniref:Nucleoside recognition family protein n=1 Tax=Maribrevibacterium harenarium TaxID=2589817 RepID=A0A501WJ71_9GAMM|nr:nucleoside recognition domain-containing protein [Maribrevibacterium harenarium]TPE47187.1 nucleoside recognition family protein [Maribrevibacterium harenarium]